ncbi:MAG: hypothetical protein ACOCNL_09810 [Acetivibrio ethanolgignens]
MSYLYFEDDELDILYQAINNLQFCFHPTYAPEGKFTVKASFELQSGDKDITIIADKNLVSPICEVAKNGTLNDKHRLQKVALFITWTKYLNARLTCGIGLLENDTAGLSTATGEENRLQFLHGVDNIPAIIWKNIAFGYRDAVPEAFLYRGTVTKNQNYNLDDHLLLLSNEAAITKIVELIRTTNMQPIDRFICFMNWYTDHLDIAESIMVYAAMVFASIPNVSPPKKAQSKSFDEVQKGVKNQAWDITYITTWSMLYYNEAQGSCNMFATDDTTQKIIIVNVLPPGQCAKAIDAIFTTKAQRKKLKELAETKLGAARVRPFRNMKEEEKITAVKGLLNKEYEALRKMCIDN